NGLVDLRAPHRYRGKLSASVSDLSTLEPLLTAYGNERKLAGSFFINWDGRGEAATTFKHSGSLKLALEKGRYGDLQSLQAKAEAAYSPAGLNVPILFLGSNKMDFQAIVRASGATLSLQRSSLIRAQPNMLRAMSQSRLFGR